MKKISNLLMMALLTIGMGLTSCDEQLDNAVSPGVMPDVEDNVAVTSVTLDKTELALTIGDAAVQLTATVKPDNATDADVDWSSSDVSVATVDGSGLVTAVADGTATITAKAGDKTAECKVTVKAAAAYLKWDNTKKELVATPMPNAYNTVTSSTTTWAAGTYVVEGEVTISAQITITGDVDLIIKDGAKLTVNNYIYGSDKNLSIYGQANQTGQLVVNCSNNDAIRYITTLEVHSCQVTATSSSSNYGGFYGIKTFNVYGGSVDAENTGTQGYGISPANNGSMNIYGGDVKAVGKGTHSTYSYGIRTTISATVTVYGGKLWAENADQKAFYSNVSLTKGVGFAGTIQTSDDGTSWNPWGDGTPTAKYVKVGY